jgi:murein L,D-transpeptidase YcbB/YkuD
MRRLCLAFVALGVVTACSVLAQSVPTLPSASDVLRERIARLRADPDAQVAGTRLAARRLLPELYERRGYTPLWTASAARDDLLRAVRDSAADGLDPEDYLLSPLERARAAADAPGAALDAQVDYDVLQSEALIRLVYHLIFGKVDQESGEEAHWNFTRLHHGDRAEFFQKLIDSGELYVRIDAEKPRHPLYQRLKAELAHLRGVAAGGGWPSVARGPTLELGMSDSRVTSLRARLAASGDLDPAEAGRGKDFDAALAAAVARFQARHGLEQDGRAGAQTLAELNVPVTARIEQLRVNLERGRWLLHDLDPTFIVVNAAAFELYYVRDGEVVWRARTQVGTPVRETPSFRSTIKYLVVNPSWTVPPVVFEQDILPAQQRDQRTLEKKGLQVVDYSGAVVPTSSIDWAKTTKENFRYLLRQPPGPENALGRVKFVFPNPHSVYLHDTPTQRLFERGQRTFSSGCIRVENALDLATLLLEGQEGWDRAGLDAAVAAGETRQVSLAKRVPILVTYWTAWVDQSGVLQLRRDVYGRDAKLSASLAARF